MWGVHGRATPLAMSRRYRHNDFTEPMMQKVCPGCWRFVCAARALLGFVASRELVALLVSNRRGSRCLQG